MRRRRSVTGCRRLFLRAGRREDARVERQQVALWAGLFFGLLAAILFLVAPVAPLGALAWGACALLALFMLLVALLLRVFD
jgi:hypothetical protein